jgi:hypothetical protein
MEFAWDNPNQVQSQVREFLAARSVRIAEIPPKAVRLGTFQLLSDVKAEVPKRTSTLARSWTAQVDSASQVVTEGRVGSPLAYARYVNEGTGIFGPKKSPIVPRTARALKLPFVESRGGATKTMFRMSIKGMKATHYFDTAFRQFVPRWLVIIENQVAKESQA